MLEFSAGDREGAVRGPAGACYRPGSEPIARVRKRDSTGFLPGDAPSQQPTSLRRACSRYSGAGHADRRPIAGQRCDQHRECRHRDPVSAQSASRQHEPEWRPRGCITVAAEPRAVQAARRSGSNGRLGFPSVADDPRDDCREIDALSEDRGTLDDVAPGRVRPRQPRHQGENRIVLHCSHRTPAAKSLRADRCGGRCRRSANLAPCPYVLHPGRRPRLLSGTIAGRAPRRPGQGDTEGGLPALDRPNRDRRSSTSASH